MAFEEYEKPSAYLFGVDEALIIDKFSRCGRKEEGIKLIQYFNWVKESNYDVRQMLLGMNGQQVSWQCLGIVCYVAIGRWDWRRIDALASNVWWDEINYQIQKQLKLVIDYNELKEVAAVHEALDSGFYVDAHLRFKHWQYARNRLYQFKQDKQTYYNFGETRTTQCILC